MSTITSVSQLPAPAPLRLPGDDRVRAVVRFYESLRPSSVAEIERLYTPDAFFKDPFNEVHGTAAIRRIFVHMFDQVDLPRFVVDSAACEGDTAFIGWTMSFRRRGRPDHEQTIRGCTALRFDAAGRVSWHRDYWDAAEELYEKLPLLGALMRWLRRRLAA
jgi:steroid Delta-isomerase